MKSKRYYLLISLFVVGTIFLSTCYFKSKEKAKEEAAAVKVMTEKIKRGTYRFPLQTHGILARKKTVKLSFKTGGIISTIPVDEGQKVRKEQILARLDLSEIEAQVTKAGDALDKAGRDFKRVENLYKDQAATLEQFENVKTSLNIARANFRVASFNKAHSIIKAPSDGTILKRFFEQGEMVSTGRPVFLFASLEKNPVIRVGLSDRDIITIKLGDPARIVFDPFPGRIYQGAVTEIAQAADPSTGTYEVEVMLNTNDECLKAGFVGRVSITASRPEKLMLIPVSALVEADGLSGYVFIPGPGKKRAKKLKVVIRKILAEQIAIASGLRDLEELIVKGAEYLTEDTRIEIVNRH